MYGTGIFILINSKSNNVVGTVCLILFVCLI